jgi:hypothetical protein
MAWMARVAGWSALLALPAWLLMPLYQQLLASLAGFTLATLGMKVQFEDVMVAAPFDLALFAAMCLASLRVSRRRRMRSLLIGGLALVAGEVLVVVAVVLLTVAGRSSGHATTARIADHLGESIPWVAAALAWLVLFGKEELPGPSRLPARRTGLRIAR